MAMSSYRLSNEAAQILRRVLPHLPQRLRSGDELSAQEVACILLEGLLQVRLILSTDGRSDVVVPGTYLLSESWWTTPVGDGAGVLTVGRATCGGVSRVAATLGLVTAVLGEDAPEELRALTTVAIAEGLVGAVTRWQR